MITKRYRLRPTSSNQSAGDDHALTLLWTCSRHYNASQSWCPTAHYTDRDSMTEYIMSQVPCQSDAEALDHIVPPEDEQTIPHAMWETSSPFPRPLLAVRPLLRQPTHSLLHDLPYLGTRSLTLSHPLGIWSVICRTFRKYVLERI